MMSPDTPTLAANAAVRPAPLSPPSAAEPAAAPDAPVPSTDQALDAAAARQAEAYESQKRVEIAKRLVGADKSLVIEKDPASQGFIYKSIDKSTGEVVRIWPKEEVASRLAALSDVDARGMMLDARA